MIINHFRYSLNFLIALLSISAFCFFTQCDSKPTQINYVSDIAGVLDSIQISKFNDLYRNHEKLTTNQIVLLTTDSFSPDSTIEEYALKQLRNMGIGQKNVNNGLLIVFSKSLRKVRIELGYGTETVLTSAKAKNIIDSIMVPRFKEEKYFEGLWNASKEITGFLEKPENKIH